MIDGAYVYMFHGEARVRVFRNDVDNLEIVYEEQQSGGRWVASTGCPLETDRIDDVLEAIQLIRKGVT